jgi:hypothetical protein
LAIRRFFARDATLTALTLAVSNPEAEMEFGEQ